MENSWKRLICENTHQLESARISLHKSVQLIASTGRSYYPSDPGDIYGSLTFKDDILFGKVLVNNIQFGLSIEDFSITLLGEGLRKEKSLFGSSNAEAIEWIREELSKSGLNPEQYDLELPYDIPDYGNPEETYPVGGKDGFRELSNLYHNANLILTEISARFNNASAVICWPHHFDIATLITLEEGINPEESISIGIGMSPGDDNYNQPYFYVSPWPYPDKEEVSDLELTYGHWHTEGLVGGILTLEVLAESESASEQYRITSEFVQSAYVELVDLLL